jgi:hypothetical protein
LCRLRRVRTCQNGLRRNHGGNRVCVPLSMLRRKFRRRINEGRRSCRPRNNCCGQSILRCDATLQNSAHGNPGRGPSAAIARVLQSTRHHFARQTHGSGSSTVLALEPLKANISSVQEKQNPAHLQPHLRVLLEPPIGSQRDGQRSAEFSANAYPALRPRHQNIKQVNSPRALLPTNQLTSMWLETEFGATFQMALKLQAMSQVWVATVQLGTTDDAYRRSSRRN